MATLLFVFSKAFLIQLFVFTIHLCYNHVFLYVYHLLNLVSKDYVLHYIFPLPIENTMWLLKLVNRLGSD